jgi:hypothetical protein
MSNYLCTESSDLSDNGDLELPQSVINQVADKLESMEETGNTLQASVNMSYQDKRWWCLALSRFTPNKPNRLIDILDMCYGHLIFPYLDGLDIYILYGTNMHVRCLSYNYLTMNNKYNIDIAFDLFNHFDDYDKKIFRYQTRYHKRYISNTSNEKTHSDIMTFKKELMKTSNAINLLRRFNYTVIDKAYKQYTDYYDDCTFRYASLNYILNFIDLVLL